MAKSKRKKVEQEKKIIKEKGSGPLFWATILISAGLLFLLSDFELINFDWRIFTLFMGTIFILAYVFSKVWAFLIPGIIISCMSLIFLYGDAGLWYIYPGIIGLSFLAVYITREENTGWAVIPAAILLAVSLVSMLEYYTDINMFSVILILVGSYLLFKYYKK